MDTQRRGVGIGLLGVTLVLIGGCLGPKGGGIFGGEPTDFAKLDTDSDASVTSGEFATWGEDQGVLDAYMGDIEGEISDSALALGLYDLWDIEGAGLSEAEWNEGLKIWFPDAAAQDFAAWDLNMDGTINRDELVAGIAHGGLVQGWDEDGNQKISTEEAYDRFYDVFDRDGDDALTAAEWRSGLATWNWDF
ncbi:MAG: hypothetical protein Q8P18_15840 [Pseudomonadota bacterium]|nr:hypothetical protein [Pseudomonadota bacterium]